MFNVISKRYLSHLVLSEYEVSRQTFVPEEDEVPKALTKLYSEELHIRVIQSSRITWAGHVACLRKWKIHTKLWQETLKEGGNLREQVVDERHDMD